MTQTTEEDNITDEAKDISTHEENEDILWALVMNDLDFQDLRVCHASSYFDDYDYVPSSKGDLEKLGRCIGSNTSLRELCLDYHDSFENELVAFGRSMNQNKHLEKIIFNRLPSGKIFQTMMSFFANNDSLTCIQIEDCDFGGEGCQSLAKAIDGCNKSLKAFDLSNDLMWCDNHVEPSQLICVMQALCKHPQLEVLEIQEIETRHYDLWNPPNYERECRALSTLMQTATDIHTLRLACNGFGDSGVQILVDGISALRRLQTLSLRRNRISDGGMEILAAVLVKCTHLRYLDLSCNFQTTSKGWRTVLTLLESPNSNLEELVLQDCRSIGDEEAACIANALSTNRKLQKLDLKDSSITDEGWSPFKKVLCDESSVNATYSSNHYLSEVKTDYVRMPSSLKCHLLLNQCNDKEQVAITKILKYHSTINMIMPLFEWELKMLPRAVSWFHKTQGYPRMNAQDTEIRKLHAIYQFMRTFPGELEGLNNTQRKAAGSKRKSTSVDAL